MGGDELNGGDVCRSPVEFVGFGGGDPSGGVVVGEYKVSGLDGAQEGGELDGSELISVDRRGDFVTDSRCKGKFFCQLAC